MISTPLAIRQYDIDPHPREGQVQVRGADDGLLVPTVLSTRTVRAQLDANDDGTFEATKDVRWGDLIRARPERNTRAGRTGPSCPDPRARE